MHTRREGGAKGAEDGVSGFAGRKVSDANGCLADLKTHAEPRSARRKRNCRAEEVCHSEGGYDVDESNRAGRTLGVS